MKIGYHTWYDENIVVSSVLEDGGLSLVVSNLKDNTNKTIHQISDSEDEPEEVQVLDDVQNNNKEKFHHESFDYRS